MKFYYQLFSKIYEEAAKKMCQDCQPFIKMGSKILDLGCGSGIITETFQNFFQAEILGVDIQDNRIRDIPFKNIDGKNLPFNDNEFEIVLISYVLHHTENPKQLLKEAKRVSKRIIIYEDLPEEGKLVNFFCKIHEATFNLLFPKLKNSTGYRFKTEKAWEELFKELGFEIIFKKKIVHAPLSRFKLGKRIFFVLEKRSENKS